MTETQTNPELLCHPNIPRPLHGLNPRSIMGAAWWDKKRREAYRARNYHCWACGVHKDDAIIKQWLEGHERYTVDYIEGRMKVKGIAALCHACHAFIHNGRTYGVAVHAGGRKSIKRAFTIFEHGFDVLSRAGLPDNQYALYSTWKLCEFVKENGIGGVIPGWAERKMDSLSLETLLIALSMREDSQVEWKDWRLEFNGQLYEPLYNDEVEWEAAMVKNNETMFEVDRRAMQAKLNDMNADIGRQLGGILE